MSLPFYCRWWVIRDGRGARIVEQMSTYGFFAWIMVMEGVVIDTTTAPDVAHPYFSVSAARIMALAL
jgi:hypothetical protein